MADFVEAVRLDQLPLGMGTAVTIAGKMVALFNVEGKIHAIDDTCPHAGGSLSTGRLERRIVTCPVHGMKIDVTTGCFATGSGFAVASYPVKEDCGTIMVAIGTTEK